MTNGIHITKGETRIGNHQQLKLSKTVEVTPGFVFGETRDAKINLTFPINDTPHFGTPGNLWNTACPKLMRAYAELLTEGASIMDRWIAEAHARKKEEERLKALAEFDAMI